MRENPSSWMPLKHWLAVKPKPGWCAAGKKKPCWKPFFPPTHRLMPSYQREELEDEPGWVTLSREIRKEGRTSSRVNGRSVSQTLLKEIGSLPGGYSRSIGTSVAAKYPSAHRPVGSFCRCRQPVGRISGGVSETNRFQTRT